MLKCWLAPFAQVLGRQIQLLCVDEHNGPEDMVCNSPSLSLALIIFLSLFIILSPQTKDKLWDGGFRFHECIKLHQLLFYSLIMCSAFISLCHFKGCLFTPKCFIIGYSWRTCGSGVNHTFISLSLHPMIPLPGLVVSISKIPAEHQFLKPSGTVS